MRAQVACIAVLLVVLYLDCIVCPPVTPAKPTDAPKDGSQSQDDREDEKFGLEYERYLKEVVSVLESDDTFRKKLEESNVSDIKVSNFVYDKYLKEVMALLAKDDKFRDVITKYVKDNGLTKLTDKSGEIARHLEFVNHGIRSKLDELKRKEIDRLRQAMKMQSQLERGIKFAQALPINPAAVVQGFKQMGRDLNLPQINKERVLAHVDHRNPNTFEVEDLAKLIKQATDDLEDLDRKRRDQFKEYEMEKERDRKEHLEKLDEQKRQEELRQYDEMKRKHAEHPKLHHPGNKEQLQEVWEETDGMDKDDFEPKTFFYMHDTNGDGLLDEEEVEALFQKELDKIYDPNNPEDDMMERDEEMNRMREHVFSEVDTDGNKLITLKEFMISANGDDFEKEEGWDSLDEQKIYTDEELEQYIKEYEERQRQDYEEQGHKVPLDPSQPPQDNLQFQGQGQFGHDQLQGQGQPQGGAQHMGQQQQQMQQQQFAQGDVPQQQIVDQHILQGDHPVQGQEQIVDQQFVQGGQQVQDQQQIGDQQFVQGGQQVQDQQKIVDQQIFQGDQPLENQQQIVDQQQLHVQEGQPIDAQIVDQQQLRGDQPFQEQQQIEIGEQQILQDEQQIQNQQPNEQQQVINQL